MNAAFLLVTSAWLAGQAPAPAPAPAAKPAPAAAAPAVTAAGCGTCCNDCNTCCDDGCGRQGLLSRLRGLCNKNRDCCDTCNTCAPTCAAPATCCDSGCNDCCGRQGLLSRLGGLCRKNKGDDCCNTCAPTCATSCCDDGCGKGRLFGGGRLRGLFRKGGDCCDSCCDTCGTGCGTGCAGAGCGAAPAPATQPEPIPAPKDAPKKMPTTGAAPMKQVQIITPATETINPFELHRRYEARVTHAPDYSWLTGQLFYVHADGGLWILRYAPLWQEDSNGGSIILARDLRMDKYREGDLVTVHGEILSKKGSVFLGGPLYRASSIELVDRDAK